MPNLRNKFVYFFENDNLLKKLLLLFMIFDWFIISSNMVDIIENEGLIGGPRLDALPETAVHFPKLEDALLHLGKTLTFIQVSEQGHASIRLRKGR